MPRSMFSAMHVKPFLVLRWVVEGDLTRQGDAQTTLTHNVRADLKDRLEAGERVSNRRPVGQERVVPVRHRAKRATGATTFSIGRAADSDLFLNDYTVSMQHARLHWLNRIERWMIEDTRSTNGTWVNGTQLPPQQRALVSSCDELQLGRLVLLFLDADDLHRYLVGDY